MLDKVKKDLKELGNPEKAKILARFFKTGKGEYGEGGIFLGITVPEQRKVAKKYKDLSFGDVKELIKSKVHEHRLTGFLVLVQKFNNSDERGKKDIVDFYLKNTKYVNNWDLVDLSANKILGKYLLNKDKTTLYKLAKSKDLWERRIAIIATYEGIINKKFEDTLEIFEILLNDKQDLIQKAVGWMLRELGKKDQKVEEEFLKKHYRNMPRTMLRYAIERFSREKREFYMKK